MTTKGVTAKRGRTRKINSGGDTLVRRVAANVRAQMGMRGLTQGDVARSLGITQQSFSPKYRGLVPLALWEIEALAKAWDVEVVELIDPTGPIGYPSHGVNSGCRSRKPRLSLVPHAFAQVSALAA